MKLRHIQDLIAGRLDSWFASHASHGNPVPWMVKRAIKLFLTCMDPMFGHAKVVCRGCRFQGELAPSCKRSFCPRCGWRRCFERTGHLIDNVLVDEPIRHWVLMLPAQLRFIIASYPQLFASGMKCFADSIFEYLRWKAKRELGLPSVRVAYPGGIGVPHFVSANLFRNPHYHCLVPDGVHVLLPEGGPPTFRTVSPPTPDEIARVAERTCIRMLNLLKRNGYWAKSPESVPHGIRGTLSLGNPRLVTFYGQQATQDPSDREGEPFSVFADDCVKQGDRKGLERLVRYLLAPPFNVSQLRLDADGRLVLKLKRPRHDGTTEERFTIEEFLDALKGLVTKPRTHTLRYLGSLARRSATRKYIIRHHKVHERSPVLHDPSDADAMALRTAMIKLNVRYHREEFRRCPRCMQKLELVALVTPKFTYRNPQWMPPDTPTADDQAEFKTGSSPIPAIDEARSARMDLPEITV